MEPNSRKKTQMCMLNYIDGIYRTKPRRISFLTRVFSSIIFYIKFIIVIFKASRLSKKGEYTADLWIKSSIDVIHALENVGASIEITGISNLASIEGSCVIISNHMSTLETVALPGFVQPVKDITYVVKRSLIEYPIFKHIMINRDPIVVSRINPREDLKTVLEGGAERLKAGISIIVFPQTTRTDRLDPEQFNSIGVKLAKRANVPILPLALKTDAWCNGKIIKDFGGIDTAQKVHFAFGEPLEVKGRGVVEHKSVIEFITGKLEEWEK